MSTLDRRATRCLVLVFYAFFPYRAASLPATAAEERSTMMRVLTESEWQEVDNSVQKALQWLASSQGADGSFPTRRNGQPGITALAVIAFLSSGHLPAQGEYSEQLSRAIRYTLDCQKDDGIISRTAMADTGSYNHAISGLMLSEIYGMVPPALEDETRIAITRALTATYREQNRIKDYPEDRGGWRYLPRRPDDRIKSDLSLTSWQLMFLRSAKNAGIEVEEQVIERAMQYIVRLYYPPTGTFRYALNYRSPTFTTRGMTGAGILSLAMAGQHETEMAHKAAEWILDHPFTAYNRSSENDNDSYHYGAYYCSHAMYQMGGKYWESFYPSLAKTLLANQATAGHWHREAVGTQGQWGLAYPTSMAVMALCTPYQLLPIFQR